jgi:hypothetical protein
MRHKRAIKRLVNKLGGRKPYLDEDLEPKIKEDDTSQEQQETDSLD